ncbi:MAG: succinate dehydrogenase assembly factor 2 [Gammaproteobacteria bacterium]|nr:succinate dehydrogenase assembly factor 2 [Gammaproteobacteria bacterium]
MRELDVLLERYMDRRYGQAGATERAAFQALLELQDPLLIDYLMGRVEAPDAEVADVVARILDADPAR